MADAEARLLDSSMEAPSVARGSMMQAPAGQQAMRPANPLVSNVVEGTENRLVAIAETVGFTVNTSPMGRMDSNTPGTVEHAQGSGAEPRRDFSEVDLALSKDHWDPLSDARWAQAAEIVSITDDTSVPLLLATHPVVKNRLMLS